jgi:hypothetical protein
MIGNKYIKDNTMMYPFDTKEQAVENIKIIYEKYEVCLGEIMASIEINNCSVEEVIEIYAMARKVIDDYDVVVLDDGKDTGIIDLKGFNDLAVE